MFILSEEQFGSLLRAGGFRSKPTIVDKPLDMLDIGAGDGEVTQRLINSVRQLGDVDSGVDGLGACPAAADGTAGADDVAQQQQCDETEAKVGQSAPPRELRVYATEYSYTMRNRLQKKNFMWVFGANWAAHSKFNSFSLQSECKWLSLIIH